jgi:DNA-binding transcriptional LysR family regulator
MMELLNDMALFVEVARTMSFRRASEVTGIPNSTLSRRISQLEQSIGLRLLHRTTRKIELTEAGILYYERCRPIVDEAKLAHEQLGEMLAHPSGILRASLPVDFAITFLVPLIPEFSRRYPGIAFEFDLTPRKVDMVSESFDVAIRMGELSNSNLIARRLALLPTSLYASPVYLDRSTALVMPEDLSQHECISILKSTNWNLHFDKKTVQVPVGSKFSVNNVGMIRQLAKFDMGIILIPDKIVKDDVHSGKLSPVLPQWKGDSIPVYAITETRLLPAKTRCFIDFLKAHLKSDSTED